MEAPSDHHSAQPRDNPPSRKGNGGAAAQPSSSLQAQQRLPTTAGSTEGGGGTFAVPTAEGGGNQAALRFSFAESAAAQPLPPPPQRSSSLPRRGGVVGSNSKYVADDNGGGFGGSIGALSSAAERRRPSASPTPLISPQPSPIKAEKQKRTVATGGEEAKHGLVGRRGGVEEGVAAGEVLPISKRLGGGAPAVPMRTSTHSHSPQKAMKSGEERGTINIGVGVGIGARRQPASRTVSPQGSAAAGAGDGVGKSSADVRRRAPHQSTNVAGTKSFTDIGGAPQQMRPAPAASAPSVGTGAKGRQIGDHSADATPASANVAASTAAAAESERERAHEQLQAYALYLESLVADREAALALRGTSVASSTVNAGANGAGEGSAAKESPAEKGKEEPVASKAALVGVVGSRGAGAEEPEVAHATIPSITNPPIVTPAAPISANAAANTTAPPPADLQLQLQVLLQQLLLQQQQQQLGGVVTAAAMQQQLQQQPFLVPLLPPAAYAGMPPSSASAATAFPQQFMYQPTPTGQMVNWVPSLNASTSAVMVAPPSAVESVASSTATAPQPPGNAPPIPTPNNNSIAHFHQQQYFHHQQQQPRHNNNNNSTNGHAFPSPSSVGGDAAHALGSHLSSRSASASASVGLHAKRGDASAPLLLAEGYNSSGDDGQQQPHSPVRSYRIAAAAGSSGDSPHDAFPPPPQQTDSDGGVAVGREMPPLPTLPLVPAAVPAGRPPPSPRRRDTAIFQQPPQPQRWVDAAVVTTGADRRGDASGSDSDDDEDGPSLAPTLPYNAYPYRAPPDGGAAASSSNGMAAASTQRGVSSTSRSPSQLAASSATSHPYAHPSPSDGSGGYNPAFFAAGAPPHQQQQVVYPLHAVGVVPPPPPPQHHHYSTTHHNYYYNTVAGPAPAAQASSSSSTVAPYASVSAAPMPNAQQPSSSSSSSSAAAPAAPTASVGPPSAVAEAEKRLDFSSSTADTYCGGPSAASAAVPRRNGGAGGGGVHSPPQQQCQHHQQRSSPRARNGGVSANASPHSNGGPRSRQRGQVDEEGDAAQQQQQQQRLAFAAQNQYVDPMHIYGASSSNNNNGGGASPTPIAAGVTTDVFSPMADGHRKVATTPSRASVGRQQSSRSLRSSAAASVPISDHHASLSPLTTASTAYHSPLNMHTRSAAAYADDYGSRRHPSASAASGCDGSPTYGAGSGQKQQHHQQQQRNESVVVPPMQKGAAEEYHHNEGQPVGMGVAMMEDEGGGRGGPFSPNPSSAHALSRAAASRRDDAPSSVDSAHRRYHSYGRGRSRGDSPEAAANSSVAASSAAASPPTGDSLVAAPTPPRARRDGDEWQQSSVNASQRSNSHSLSYSHSLPNQSHHHQHYHLNHSATSSSSSPPRPQQQQYQEQRQQSWPRGAEDSTHGKYTSGRIDGQEDGLHQKKLSAAPVNAYNANHHHHPADGDISLISEESDAAFAPPLSATSPLQQQQQQQQQQQYQTASPLASTRSLASSSSPPMGRHLQQQMSASPYRHSDSLHNSSSGKQSQSRPAAVPSNRSDSDDGGEASLSPHRPRHGYGHDASYHSDGRQQHQQQHLPSPSSSQRRGAASEGSTAFTASSERSGRGASSAAYPYPASTAGEEDVSGWGPAASVGLREEDSAHGEGEGFWDEEDGASHHHAYAEGEEGEEMTEESSYMHHGHDPSSMRAPAGSVERHEAADGKDASPSPLRSFYSIDPQIVKIRMHNGTPVAFVKESGAARGTPTTGHRNSRPAATPPQAPPSPTTASAKASVKRNTSPLTRGEKSLSRRGSASASYGSERPLPATRRPSRDDGNGAGLGGGVGEEGPWEEESLQAEGTHTSSPPPPAVNSTRLSAGQASVFVSPPPRNGYPHTAAHGTVANERYYVDPRTGRVVDAFSAAQHHYHQEQPQGAVGAAPIAPAAAGAASQRASLLQPRPHYAKGRLLAPGQSQGLGSEADAREQRLRQARALAMATFAGGEGAAKRDRVRSATAGGGRGGGSLLPPSTYRRSSSLPAVPPAVYPKPFEAYDAGEGRGHGGGQQQWDGATAATGGSTAYKSARYIAIEANERAKRQQQLQQQPQQWGRPDRSPQSRAASASGKGAAPRAAAAFAPNARVRPPPGHAPYHGGATHSATLSGGPLPAGTTALNRYAAYAAEAPSAPAVIIVGGAQNIAGGIGAGAGVGQRAGIAARFPAAAYGGGHANGVVVRRPRSNSGAARPAGHLQQQQQQRTISPTARQQGVGPHGGADSSFAVHTKAFVVPLRLHRPVQDTTM